MSTLTYFNHPKRSFHVSNTVAFSPPAEFSRSVSRFNGTVHRCGVWVAKSPWSRDRSRGTAVTRTMEAGAPRSPTGARTPGRRMTLDDLPLQTRPVSLNSTLTLRLRRFHPLSTVADNHGSNTWINIAEKRDATNLKQTSCPIRSHVVSS